MRYIRYTSPSLDFIIPASSIVSIIRENSKTKLVFTNGSEAANRTVEVKDDAIGQIEHSLSATNDKIVTLTSPEVAIPVAEEETVVDAEPVVEAKENKTSKS